LTPIDRSSDRSAAPRETPATQIERFLRARYQIRADDAGFTHHANLWEEGYVDSVGVVEVIEFLEGTFNLRVPDDVLFSEEFTCIAGMAAFVEASLESPAPLPLEARDEDIPAMKQGHQARIA
jgi:acyl carrier protein